MELKFCKDCQHFNNTKLGLECIRPDGVSLVTGEPKFRKIAAETERGLDALGCGTTARYFTLKQI